MLATIMHVAHSDPAFSYGCRKALSIEPTKRVHHSDDPLFVDAEAVEQLKQLLRKTHPTYFGFSLVSMRKVTTPPVQIPALYRTLTTTATLVGGHAVPLTRTMWMRRQRQHPHELTMISEGDEDPSTDRRK